MVIDVDLNLAASVADHGEDIVVIVVELGESLSADERERLAARREVAQVVEVDLVALAMIEIHDGVGMPRWARFQRPKDEVVSTWAAKQHVAGRTAYQEIVAAQSLDRVVGTPLSVPLPPPRVMVSVSVAPALASPMVTPVKASPGPPWSSSGRKPSQQWSARREYRYRSRWSCYRLRAGRRRCSGRLA